jgi:hypothetical protein
LLRRRWRIAALTSLLVVGSALPVGHAPTPAPARAAAPPPPLDECLAKGTFRQSETICSALHKPASGSDLGVISGVIRHPVAPGQTVTLRFAGGDTIDFDRPLLCGEQGCLYNRMGWRPEDGARFDVIAGCGDRDTTCTVRFWPTRFVGDEAERWTVLYAEHFGGRRSVSGVAHAFYAPPRFYPVRLAAQDAQGAPVPFDRAAVAYAVRSGSSAVASACAGVDWVWPLMTVTDPALPDCVALRSDPDAVSGAQRFAGYLPVDSGDWTIVAEPAGADGAPLAGRPTPYRPLSVAPTGDDIAATLMALPEQALRVTVTPETTVMTLGTEQLVSVTVDAPEPEAGALEGVTFTDPAILGIEADGPVLEIAEVVEPAPAGPFPLEPGASRTVTLRVRAVGTGLADVGAEASATDALGRPVRDAEGGSIRVDLSLPGPGTDPLPPPPELVAAVTGAAGGRVIGTVEGAPGAEVSVIAWSAPAPADASCIRDVSGPAAGVVGSIDLTLDDTGRAAFEIPGTLAIGSQAVAVAVAGGTSSMLSDCVPVTDDVPLVRVGDASVTEGTGDDPTTLEVPVTLAWPGTERVTVWLGTSDGSATAPADHVALDGAIVELEPGETATTVEIAIVADRRAEEDETFTVTIGEVTGARADPAATSATATILDDDGDAETALDLRGTWRAVAGDFPRSARMVIRSQDPLRGVIRVDEDTALEIVGGVAGDRLTIDLRDSDGDAATLSGRVVRRDGALQVTLTGKDDRGRAGRVTFRLTDPAG